MTWVDAEASSKAHLERVMSTRPYSPIYQAMQQQAVKLANDSNGSKYTYLHDLFHVHLAIVLWQPTSFIFHDMFDCLHILETHTSNIG